MVWRARGPLGILAALSASLLGAWAAAPSADQEALLVSLETVLAESEAKALLAPHLENLKALDPQVITKVVSRQWWELARDIVQKSHTQQVDLSFNVRKAVQTLKEEADELLRTLNPKYGQAQQVAPAFQWAQNDTSIFLTIKYTVRWNAPGALEVTDPSVNMTGNVFNFTGLGKHSNNKYKYWLSLNMFDDINPDLSSWSAASVGKLSVTLRKKWARKWPRLIANKKLKISNMHIWSERQESLDGTLSGMSTVTNSPVTCRMAEKLYCLATDTCKKADACAQCPGKVTPKEDEWMCTGKPTEKAGISFKDGDMDFGEIGGEVKITKARNDFDIDAYEIYFGRDDHNKYLNLDGTAAKAGSAPSLGTDTEVKIPMNTPFPEGATHLLVFSTNSFGEFATPGSTSLVDATLPKAKPGQVEFTDEDGDKGEISGKVTIGKAEIEDHLEEYALHWGKSEKKRISSGSHIREVRKSSTTTNEVTHTFGGNTKVPEGATHILVYSKNTHGEFPTSSALKFVDRTKPCAKKGDADCVQGLSVKEPANPASDRATFTIQRAKDESTLTTYSLYWGRESCEAGGGQSGAKNGFIVDLPTVDKETGKSDGADILYNLPKALAIPAATTHVLAFSKNNLGQADNCISVEYKKEDAEGKKEL